MSKFIDGPAAGVTLELRRAPVFLRVVIDPAGKVDALDQLDDTPAANEKIFVYRIDPKTLFRAHVCRRSKGQRSGWIESGDYRLHPSQPGDAVRETAAWQEWTTSEVPQRDDQ